MQLSEIVEVLRFVIDGIAAHNLIAQYQSIHQLLQAAAGQPRAAVRSGQPTNPSVPVQPPNAQQTNAQVVQLRDTIMQSQSALEPPVGWNAARREIFDGFGARGVVGKEASDALAFALSQNALDPAQAAVQIQRLLQNVAQLHQRCNQALTALTPLAQAVQPATPSTGQAAVVLTFTKGAAIRTLEDLKVQADRWNYIATVFAELTGAPTESPPLIEVRRGSIILELSAALTVALSLVTIVHNIVMIRELRLKSQKIALEIRGMKFSESAAKAVEADAEAEAARIVAEAADNLLDENGWSKTTDPTKRNEFSARLAKCIRDVAEFEKQGGEIEFRFPPHPAAAGENKELAARGLEKQARLAEAMRRAEQMSAEVQQLRQLPPKSTSSDQTQ